MTEITSFDEVKFWQLYDQHLIQSTQELRNQLREIIKTHEKIRDLKRPEKNWKHIRAWEALGTTMIQSDNGMWRFTISCGEIIIEQHCWDRDVYITHVPQEEHVSGGVLGNSQWNDGKLFGLFLPLYDADIIQQRIIIRLEEAKQDALKFLAEERRSWR